MTTAASAAWAGKVKDAFKVFEAAVKAWADGEKAKALAAKNAQVTAVKTQHAEHAAKHAAEIKAAEELLAKTPKEDNSLPGRFLNTELHITNYHKQQLGITDQGVFFMSQNKSGWETWTLEPIRNSAHFYLKCSSGYLASFDENPEGKPTGISQIRDHFQMFTLSAGPDGSFIFTNVNGTQLSQSDQGVVWQSPNKDKWEYFTLTRKDGQAWASTTNAKYAEQKAKVEHLHVEEKKHSGSADHQNQINAAEGNYNNAIAAIDRQVAEKFAAKKAHAEQVNAYLLQQCEALGRL